MKRSFTRLGHQSPFFGQERGGVDFGDVQKLDRLVGFTVGGQKNTIIEGDGRTFKIFGLEFLEYVQRFPRTALDKKGEGVRGGDYG